MTAIETRSG